MKATGVDMQIVSLWPALFRYDLDSPAAVAFVREVNDDLGTMSAEWPDNFRGFGSLPMQDVDASVAELERCVRGIFSSSLLTGGASNFRRSQEWSRRKARQILP